MQSLGEVLCAESVVSPPPVGQVYLSPPEQ